MTMTMGNHPGSTMRLTDIMAPFTYKYRRASPPKPSPRHPLSPQLDRWLSGGRKTAVSLLTPPQYKRI